jgi:hypothetical protein
MAQGLAKAGIMVGMTLRRSGCCSQCSAARRAQQPQLRRCGNGSGARNSALALIARGQQRGGVRFCFCREAGNGSVTRNSTLALIARG